MTGAFTVEGPPPEMVEVMITAMQDEIPITIPEITAMPEILVIEVNYSISNNTLAVLEVWFREPDGTR